jgi:hypothetical protein
VFAEQNNGHLWSSARKCLLRNLEQINTRLLLPINTLGPDGAPGFIHSATYGQLLQQFGLGAVQLAGTIKKKLSEG